MTSPARNQFHIPISPLSSPSSEDQDPPSTSWVPNWFPTSPRRASYREKTHKKNTSVGFDLQPAHMEGKSNVRRNFSLGASDAKSASIALNERRSRQESIVIDMDGSGETPHTMITIEEAKEMKEGKRKGKSPAPPLALASARGPSVRSNFSYDTLKERADVWKKERSKKPMRNIAQDRAETPLRELVHDRSQTFSESHGMLSAEDSRRPKICFTKEENDKVDKDILRLMDALEHNNYPFNRDKHVIFNKLRLIRRKQMGLLFAHKELDKTGYFHTDQEVFGYDSAADKLAIMYNVMDAISRDVYELRELLYYERRNQIPPNRRGSSDRRSSSEPPAKLLQVARPSLGRIPSKDETDFSATLHGRRSSLKTKSSVLVSPTKPILKHSTSVESFKSAKSEDTVTPTESKN